MKNNRREFLQKGLAGLAGATFVTVIPKIALSQRVHKIEEDERLPGWMDHYYAYVIDTSRCIGCGSCVAACKNENNVPDGFFRTWVERYQVTGAEHVFIDSPDGGIDGFPESQVQGNVVKGYFVPKMCNHCHNTPCTQVCPVHASYQTPQGAVLVDKKTCIGCGYCVQACPYGSRYIDPRTHTADKCTWCFHRVARGEPPACVAVCPTKTRRFGDLGEEDSLIKEMVEKHRVTVLKPELNTEPFCFYIGLDKAVR